MSLLGRLEDLSLTDIVQIVFLSRRTGVLEVIDSAGRHTVLFRQGMVVNASGPEHPDLAAYLEKRRLIKPMSASLLRQIEEQGVASGSTILSMNLMKPEALHDAIRDRILSVVTPLLQSREGEFNFLLSDSVTPMDMEYEPEALMKEGGFSPKTIIGLAEGEKIKPLRGLEESLKAGQALRRGNTSPGTIPLPLDLPLGQNASAPPPPPSPAPHADRTPTGKFKVTGGLFDIESPDSAYRNVLLFERDPMVRVAVRRAFSKHGVKITQFGSLDDVRSAMSDLFRSNSFFVTFLELTEDDATIRTLQQLKRRNPRLPAVVVDRESDLHRRHDLLRAGADLYLTRPSPERMQPEIAQQELALFADELMTFADRAFEDWDRQLEAFGSEAGKHFYETADQENVNRTFSVLKQLINELNDPNDIDQVAATILRLSAQYLERGALFLASDSAFVGLGGFGASGEGASMDDRVRLLVLDRNEPSILADVASSGQSHRGKIRRTEANVRLIEAMGNLLPTEVVALPILHNGEGIGILYGENAEHRAPIDTLTGLEIFLSQAGYAFGNAVEAWQKAGARGREGT